MKRDFVYISAGMLCLASYAWAGLGGGQNTRALPIVWLQASTPGQQQTGHVNISGTMKSGALETDALRLGATANAGDVLTADVNGNGTWQSPSGGAPTNQRVVHWAAFDTYAEQEGWSMDNDPSLFGGVWPSQWTDGNGTADQMSDDSSVLRTLLTQKAAFGANAMLYSEVIVNPSSTNGRVYICLFRIKNNTGAEIDWTPFIKYSAYSGWGELASCAMNGVSVWSSGTSGSTGFTMTVLANMTSTVIFAVTSGRPYFAGGYGTRRTQLGFLNNSLNLPAGLEFVDDFETMP